MSDWQVITKYLQRGKELILLVHEKPDGDCLGSALAFGQHLKEAGYCPQLFLPELIPAVYAFLPGLELIKLHGKGEQLPAGIPIIVIDCADEGRIEFPLPQDTPVVNIDHHCSNTLFGDYYLVNPNAAATGEIIYKILKESPVKISRSVATCLYVALLADTGSFSYSNTTAQTLHIAAELLECGADIESIRDNFFDKRPLEELQNIKLALNNLQFTFNHRIAWSALGYQELSTQNLLHSDTDSVINLMRSVEGVEAAIILRELEPNKVKISFRSQKQLDVNMLAGEFGGGGHARAAGCTITGDLSSVASKVITRAQQYLEMNGNLKGGGPSGKRSSNGRCI